MAEVAAALAAVTVVLGGVSAVAATVQAATASWQAHHARLKDKIQSATDSSTIHKNMLEVVRLLYAVRDNYEAALEEHDPNKKATEAYNDWSGVVMKLKKDVDDTSSKYLQSRKRNWLSQAKTDMKSSMKQKSLDANRLCDMGVQLGDIFVLRFIKMDAPDIGNLPTWKDQLESISDLVAREDSDVKCVRIWGMPGTGKTSLMQNLHNHQKVQKYFDFVIWLDVSTKKNNGSLSIDQLRQEIVVRLKLNAEGVRDDDNLVKEKLRNKKILLLLDDVSTNLKLTGIGIDLSSSKIVLTSTSNIVCESVVDMDFKIKRLPPKESLIMFKRIMGKLNHLDEKHIEKYIVKIVERCDALPFLIEKFANSFKMKDTYDSWEQGMNDLLVWCGEEDDGVMLLCKLLNVCFDKLGEAKRNCLLYSAMYPEDCDVHSECLYDCWAAEDLYENFVNFDFGTSHKYGHKVLEHLKNVSLLEECTSRAYIRMHKWVRRAALYRLAVEDKKKHLVETGRSLQSPPREELWKDKAWISLADSDIEMLPDSPECTMLSTLFLQKNPLLKTLPESFFKYMKKLRVLNMDGTGIKSLPVSMSMLAGVKVLYLNGCSSLDFFPSQILELKTIEVLDLRCSGVRAIPPEIVNLSSLRRLLVSFPNFDNDDDREVVSQNCNVISTITLKELIVDVKLHKYLCTGMQHFVIEKVATGTSHLLTTFKFCFLDGVEDDVIKKVALTATFNVPTTKAFKGFLQRKDVSKSNSLQVFIGSNSNPPKIPNYPFYEKYLRYCSGLGSDDTIVQLLKNSDAVELLNLSELENLSDFGIKNLQMVKGCLIEACNKVRAIANNLQSPFMPNLEELYIKTMPALERMFKGPIPHGSLCSLRILKIENCHLIEELLADSGPGNVLIGDFLQNLEMLILSDMPNLTKICPYNSLEWPALKKVRIDKCPKLTELPFGNNKAKNLETIAAEKIWWDDTLTWQDPDAKTRLESLLAPLG